MFKMPTPVISDQTFAHGRPLPSLFWIFSIHSFVYKYWYKDLSLENTWLGDRPLNFQFPDLYLLSRSRDSTICQNLDFATVSRSWNFNFCCQPVGTWNSWTFLFVPLFISCLPVAIFPWYLNVVAYSCQVWSSLSFWIFSNSVFPASFSTAIIIGSQSFTWSWSFHLVCEGEKVNTNDILQLRRPFRNLNPD